MILPLHDEVYLVVKTRIPGDYGGWTEVEQVSDTPTRCAIWPATATEETEGGTRVLTDTRYKAIFPAHVHLDATTSLQWRGKMFDVQGVPLTHSVRGRPHHQEVLLSRQAG